MTEQKAVHAGVQREVQEDAPAIGQHHHKGHQGSPGFAKEKTLVLYRMQQCDLVLVEGFKNGAFPKLEV